MELIIELLSGPALSRRSLVSGPGALDVGPRLPLCRAPALSPSRPGALAVLCVGPGALCLARRSLCQAPSSRRAAVCVGARRSLSHLCRTLLRRRLCVHQLRAPPTSNPRATHAVLRAPTSDPRVRVPPSGPQAPSSDPSASAGPQLRSACHPSSPARSLFIGENPKQYCLGENTDM